jgi:hypothetical protein
MRAVDIVSAILELSDPQDPSTPKLAVCGENLLVV